MGQMAGDGDLRAGWKVNVRLRSQPRAGLCCRASDYGGSGRAARVIEGRMPPDDPQPGRPEAGHAPPAAAAAAAAADCRWMRRAGGQHHHQSASAARDKRTTACTDKNSARMLSMTRR